MEIKIKKGIDNIAWPQDCTIKLNGKELEGDLTWFKLCVDVHHPVFWECAFRDYTGVPTTNLELWLLKLESKILKLERRIASSVLRR